MSRNCGRPDGTVSAAAAAHRLRIDYRTVQRLIVDRELAGGVLTVGRKKVWWVSEDALPAERATGAARPEPTPREIQLQKQVDDLRAQVVATQEANRLLREKQAIWEAAVADYHAGAQEEAASAEAYKQIIDGYQKLSGSNERAKASFRAAADKLTQMSEMDRDAISQLTSPGHVGDLGRTV